MTFQHNPDTRKTKPSAKRISVRDLSTTHCLLGAQQGRETQTTPEHANWKHTVDNKLASWAQQADQRDGKLVPPSYLELSLVSGCLKRSDGCLPGSLSISLRAVQSAERSRQWSNNAGKYCAVRPARHESHRIHWRMNHNFAGFKHTLESGSCVLWSFQTLAFYLQKSLSSTTNSTRQLISVFLCGEVNLNLIQDDTSALFEHPQENEHGPDLAERDRPVPPTHQRNRDLMKAKRNVQFHSKRQMLAMTWSRHELQS